MLALALVAALASAPPPAAASPKKRDAILVLDALALGVPKEQAQILDGALAKGLATRVDADVVTFDDVRVLVAFAADQQALGCMEGKCLTNLADAMDARWILTARLGKLDVSTVTLQLTLIDPVSLRALGRDEVSAPDLRTLVEHLGDPLSRLAKTTPVALANPMKEPPPSSHASSGLLRPSLVTTLRGKPVAVARLNKLLVVAFDNGALATVDPSTGTTTPLTGTFPDTRALASDGAAAVYVVGKGVHRVDDRGVTRVSSEDWSKASSATVHKGALYVEAGGTLFKLDGKTGASTPAQKNLSPTKLLVSTENALWRVEGQDGSLQKIDPTSYVAEQRTLGWTTRAGANKGTALFSVEGDDRLYATCLITGRYVTIAEGLHSRAVAVVDDGVVLFEEDGKVLKVPFKPKA